MLWQHKNKVSFNLKHFKLISNKRLTYKNIGVLLWMFQKKGYFTKINLKYLLQKDGKELN